MEISKFRFHKTLRVEVLLGILDEHVQHPFASCHDIALNSGFREKGRLTARNPLYIIDYLFLFR